MPFTSGRSKTTRTRIPRDTSQLWTVLDSQSRAVSGVFRWKGAIAQARKLLEEHDDVLIIPSTSSVGAAVGNTYRITAPAGNVKSLQIEQVSLSDYYSRSN